MENRYQFWLSSKLPKEITDRQLAKNLQDYPLILSYTFVSCRGGNGFVGEVDAGILGLTALKQLRSFLNKDQRLVKLLDNEVLEMFDIEQAVKELKTYLETKIDFEDFQETVDKLLLYLTDAQLRPVNLINRYMIFIG